MDGYPYTVKRSRKLEILYLFMVKIKASLPLSGITKEI